MIKATRNNLSFISKPLSMYFFLLLLRPFFCLVICIMTLTTLNMLITHSLMLVVVLRFHLKFGRAHLRISLIKNLTYLMMYSLISKYLLLQVIRIGRCKALQIRYSFSFFFRLLCQGTLFFVKARECCSIVQRTRLSFLLLVWLENVPLDLNSS